MRRLRALSSERTAVMRVVSRWRNGEKAAAKGLTHSHRSGPAPGYRLLPSQKHQTLVSNNQHKLVLLNKSFSDCDNKMHIHMAIRCMKCTVLG
jgi:hypothetical protein